MARGGEVDLQCRDAGGTVREGTCLLRDGGRADGDAGVRTREADEAVSDEGCRFRGLNVGEVGAWNPAADGVSGLGDVGGLFREADVWTGDAECRCPRTRTRDATLDHPR